MAILLVLLTFVYFLLDRFMNIQQLEYLIAVDKYKHFGKAAQACHITQPTLSAMIQKLEEELEIRIFDRTSHPIRTTDAGEEIISQAQHILDGVMELKNKAQSLNNVLSGRIRIGIIPTVSPFIIPTEMLDFLSKNEKIEISLLEMSSENIIKNLKSGDLDAGIIATPHKETEDFFSDFLFNEELFIYSSTEGKAVTSEKYISPKHLNLNKVWLLEEGNCLRKQMESICHLKENVLKPKNLEFSASTIGTLIQMVDKIGGLTILPELAKKQLTEAQSEKVYRFEKPFPMREISLIYYKPTYKQKILDELVSHLRTSLSSKLNYHQSPKDFVIIEP